MSTPKHTNTLLHHSYMTQSIILSKCLPILFVFPKYSRISARNYASTRVCTVENCKHLNFYYASLLLIPIFTHNIFHLRRSQVDGYALIRQFLQNPNGIGRISEKVGHAKSRISFQISPLPSCLTQSVVLPPHPSSPLLTQCAHNPHPNQSHLMLPPKQKWLVLRGRYSTSST